MDSELQSKYEALQDDYDKLQQELIQQQKVTDQVRTEAAAFLNEMRTLAESQNTWNTGIGGIGGEVESLRNEIKEWKSKYASSKAQVRKLKATSMVAPSSNNVPHPVIQPVNVMAATFGSGHSSYVSGHGIITEKSLSGFQTALNEFLVQTRSPTSRSSVSTAGEPSKVLLERLHAVVVATRILTQEVGTFPLDELYRPRGRGSKQQIGDMEQLQGELAQATSLVSATANHLITTTRNHGFAEGISSIFLVDSAAADLSAAVVELVKMAKIRGKSGQKRVSSISNGTNGTEEILESHTMTVIDSIQNLLTGLKSSSTTYADLRVHIASILHSVSQIVSHHHQLPSHQSHGQYTLPLKDLKKCAAKMEAVDRECSMYDEALRPEKQMKSRVAQMAYEMAKCVTEVVKLGE